MAAIHKERFTDEFINSVFLPEDGKRVTIYDDKVPGLALRITSKGTKTFVFSYKKNGKAERYLIGKWPAVKLDEARKQAHDRASDVLDGKNPAEEKRERRKMMKLSGVETVAEEWFQSHVRKLRSKWKNAEYILKKDFLPAWKGRSVGEIKKADVRLLLKKIVARGAPVGANRALTIVNAWLNWCVAEDIIPFNPATGVRKPTIEQSRDRVLNDAELAEIIAVLNAMEAPSGPFVRLLLMLGQRRGEVAAMRWRDVDFENGLWTLPKETTKANRSHDVPLCPAALEIIKSLPRSKKRDHDHIFSTTKGRLAINGFSKMKVRIDASIAAHRKANGVKGPMGSWTLHDLRRTCATQMAGAKVPSEVLSKILNHSPGSSQGITSIYNRFEYLEERRAALQAWSDHLAGLASAKDAMPKRKAGRR